MTKEERFYAARSAANNALILFQVSVLKEPNPVYSYFIECLTKHLQAPESTQIVQELKQQHSLFTQAVAQLQL